MSQVFDGVPMAPPKPRGGRPKADADALRTITVGVRLSVMEDVAVRAKAARAGMKPAAWLRAAALDRRLPALPAATSTVADFTMLGRLAGNLNQLARVANSGRDIGVSATDLTAIADQVRELQAALRGGR